MKLMNVTRHPHRRTHAYRPIGGGIITRHRLARLWPEAGERMVTAADLRQFDL